MPRELIRPEGFDRNKSLGYLATWWIETFVVQGPGDVEGEPIVHTDEYMGFIVDCYLVNPKTGRRMVDSAFFSRPKGTNKSGLASEFVLFEALGPCRFAGWAEGGETYEFLGHVYTYEKGEAMGQAVTTPIIRIMATEEDQTGNVFDQVHQNLTEGPLSELVGYGMQVGVSKVELPFGGQILPSTTGAASKDGGKETFVVFDESHLYNNKALRQMYSTVTRNLAKRKKKAEPWSLETTTMYAPGEDSIAEQTYELGQLIKEGKTRRSRLLFDHRWGEIEDLNDEEALRNALQEAYGDALDHLSPYGWVSVEGLLDAAYDVRTKTSDFRRYFLNAITGSHNAWVQPYQLDSVKTLEPERPQRGEMITLGFDGAQSFDATALIGCRVSDGLLFPIRVEEKPEGGKADEKWQVNSKAFDAAVARACKKYRVVGFFADPPYWQTYIDGWELDPKIGGKLLVEASGTSPIKWWTKRDVPMANALERLYTAIVVEKTVRVSNDAVLIRHLRNAREWERRGGLVIGKESKNSPLKIDAAMASVLAYEARALYLLKGKKPSRSFVPRRIDRKAS